MTPQFDVLITQLKSVHDIPNALTVETYRQFLEAAEFDDIDDIEPVDMLDMAIMALQDLEPEESAEIVLATILGDRLSKGVRQNLIHDMKEEALWEQYAEINCHADLFLAGVVLNQAFPKVFTYPDIGRLSLTITAINETAETLLQQTPSPAFLARLLANGMGERGLIIRLYEEQVTGTHFSAASSIIWRSEAGEPIMTDGELTRQLVIYSSWEWLRPLKEIHEFQATAHNDTSKLV